MIVASDQVNQWLKEVDPSLTLNETGKLFLTSESGVEIVVAAVDASGHIIINSDIFKIPAENKEALFEKALAFNLYQDKTMGGSISIDPISNALCLSLSLHVEQLDSVLFQNSLQNVISVTNKLKESLENLGGAVEYVSEPHSSSNAVNAMFV
ncbi:CesT family type III secretion system chaperone [Pseudomonas sp. HK3]